MPDFEDPAIVYGDSVNQLHGECRTRSVLIQFHAPRHTISQTGIIFTSGHRFCCVLTVKNDTLKDPNNSITVTFADGNETTVQVSQITLSIGSCLALLEIYDGTYQERPSAVFSEQEAAEDSLVHNLSYAAKITYAYQGTFHAAPVVSYFPGGTVSPVGLRHKGMDVFGHNCGAGYPDIIGSSVVNRNGEIVGINVVSSRGSRLALCKAAIRAEIGMLYPGRTGNLTFAAIQQQSKAATEARLASIP